MNTNLGNQHHEAVSDADKPRLKTQFGRIIDFMGDYAWHDLFEIAVATGYGTGSIGSQLRNARVDGYTITKRRKTEAGGTWEYRLQPPELKQKDLF